MASKAQIIQRSHKALVALIQHMPVNHRGLQITMAQQCLKGTNVGAALQQKKIRVRSNIPTLSEIGDHFGVHYMTVRCAVRQFEKNNRE